MTFSLAAVILTHNEQTHIRECIDSVRWADRIVVFDSFSDDQTVALAEAAGAEAIQRAWKGYASQRNAALEAVDAEWILFIDADERSSPAQAAEVRALLAAPEHHGYWIPRDNYIFGRLTRHAGWYPDYQMRLLHRGHARYDPAREVHELVLLDGEPGYMTQPFVHYNYANMRQFWEKQGSYARYDAQILKDQGIKPRPHKFVTMPLRQFIWRFVTLRGYRDGLHGLRLSLLMAWYELQKYRHLQRLYWYP